jgi:hypothetical protein
MQNFFAMKYFDPDEYFRLGVKVPVPVFPVPSGGGGSGITPLGLQRMYDCEILDKESKELKFNVNKAWDALQKKAHRDPLDRKKTAEKEIERIRERDLAKLRKKIQELTEKYYNMRKAGLEKEKFVQRLKTRADELELCYKTVEERLCELQKKINILIKENRKQRKRIKDLERSKRRSEMLRLQQFKKIKELENSKKDLELELAGLHENVDKKELIAVAQREAVTESIKDAVPYAIGSAAVLIGTRYLVPEERNFLKFAGYTGGTVLAGVALWKAAPAISRMISIPLVNSPELMPELLGN